MWSSCRPPEHAQSTKVAARQNLLAACVESATVRALDKGFRCRNPGRSEALRPGTRTCLLAAFATLDGWRGRWRWRRRAGARRQDHRAVWTGLRRRRRGWRRRRRRGRRRCRFGDRAEVIGQAGEQAVRAEVTAGIEEDGATATRARGGKVGAVVEVEMAGAEIAILQP